VHVLGGCRSRDHDARAGAGEGGGGVEDNLWSASREVEVASRKGVDVKGTLACTGE
jgi:hypothetical protein